MEAKIVKLGEKIHDALVEMVKKTNLFPLDLGGSCAVASFFLVQEMEARLGLKAELMVAPGHAFVEHRDRIYDITATQFGWHDKVLSVRRKDLNKLDNGSLIEYYSEGAVGDVDEINSDWPRCQRPASYRLTWLNQHKARVVYLRK